MTSVAVIGAGPVVASMALALIRSGFDVTFLEQAESLPADPRAASLQPPAPARSTLERGSPTLTTRAMVSRSD